MEVKVIGQMDNTIDHTFESANRVYATDGLAPTVNTCGGGGLQPKVIVAMRGRYVDDAETHTEQKLEPNTEGVSNTLTSVHKDNLLLEPILVGGIGEMWGDKQYRQGNRVYDSESVAMALTSQPVGNNGGNSYMYLTREPQYRIRKLTPKECWRLMDFTDEDHARAESVVSNSQLYKQAGNSIVKNVLVAIIGQMIPGKENQYKEIEYGKID